MLPYSLLYCSMELKTPWKALPRTASHRQRLVGPSDVPPTGSLKTQKKIVVPKVHSMRPLFPRYILSSPFECVLNSYLCQVCIEYSKQVHVNKVSLQ